MFPNRANQSLRELETLENESSQKAVVRSPISKAELNAGQSNPTLQLAKTAKLVSVFSKKLEWKAPSDTCKKSVNLDYLAGFHTSA
jgi:hypothetical protein